MDRITDRPDMTSAVHRGRKASTQTYKSTTQNIPKGSVHNDNMPMQYTWILKAVTMIILAKKKVQSMF